MRGDLGDVCGTPGCRRQARWLSVDEYRESAKPVPYRCTDCCDDIAVRFKHTGMIHVPRPRHAVGVVPAALSVLVLILCLLAVVVIAAVL